MLRQRIITAAILIAVLLPTLVAAAVWPFALLTLALIGAAGWEWGRLNGAGSGVAVAFGVALAAAGAFALWHGQTASLPASLWWAALGVWVVGGGLVLRGGPTGWPRLPATLRCVIGLAVLGVGWLALTTAKGVGLNYLLSVFALVWAADISAYFGGRAFGRRKLAPAISPGKSWEGVYSGVAGVLVLAALWIVFDRHAGPESASLYSRLFDRAGALGSVLALVFLGGMSVVGDLFESLVKRAAGAKDSSALLPGHGGVLDRIDALLPVFPLALALTMV